MSVNNTNFMETVVSNEPLKKEVGIQVRPVKATCGHSSRFIVLIQSACLIAIITSNTVVWNPSVIAITDLQSSPKYNPNITDDVDYYNDFSLPLADRRLIYSPMEKSYLFAAVFIGAIFGILPIDLMLRCFGGYRTTILMSVLSTIGSSLVPFAVSHNFVLLIVLRLILGATLSLAFPLIGTVISSWSAATESSIFVSVLTGYLQLCAIFSMTITGFFSAKVGWPSVFYIHSGAMVLLLAFWAYFYRDDIFRHRFVSEVEIRKISVGKEINKVLKKETIPYRKIVASRPIQVVWIAAGGNYLAAQFALTFWPSYLVRSLGYSLESAGFLAVIPLSLQFLAKLVAGFIGDRLHCLSDLRKIKLMNTIAFFGSAVFFVLAAAIPAEEYATMNLVFIICAIIILGFNAGGFPKAGLMCSKQFSRFVMSTIQLILCVTLCVGSFVVPLLTPNSTSDEYNVVFYIYAAALLVSNIVFVMFASAEPQPFTEQSS